ncbi:MAG: type IIA DNA topoisomerase subunit B [Gammaproteobacteria bacterium]|nr:type IIA DNA topoisomerase subunit B [Gammaproteobacteria bacterium]
MQVYDAKNIEVLTGLDPVRRRPGMYTDTSSPFHLLQELIDNAVDEALAGHATDLFVTIDNDNAFTVADNGRGIPVDMHPDHKRPAIDLILTTLHSGAKFSQMTYQYSGGLHGVGLSVVNALSARLTARVIKDGKIYEVQYKDGECVVPLKTIKSQGDVPRGTIIYAEPNPTYFEKVNISLDRLRTFLRTKALLCSTLTTHLITDAGEESWSYPLGLKAYFQQLPYTNTLWNEPWFVHRAEADYECTCVFNWADTTIISDSFVNLIPTVQGGAHVQALKTSLLEAVRDYAKTAAKPPKEKIIWDDLSVGLNFIFAIKVHDPNFQGQTKEKLGSLSIGPALTTLLKNMILSWLYTHHKESSQLMEFCERNQQERLLEDQKKQIKKSTTLKLPLKLTDCTSNNWRERELYLVEGKSAGGSAKQARDKKFQAILTLRGKILNTWDLKAHKIYESQEVKDIIDSIGVQPGSNDLSGLRYGKICLLADADSDGAHISTLLCALFVQHFPELVRRGHLYVAQPPLYRIDIGKQHFYARTLEEQEKIIAQHNNKNWSVIRFKGLGEMNANQLRVSTLDPLTRQLVQLNLDSMIHEQLDLLMNKNRAADRKKWLEQ